MCCSRGNAFPSEEQLKSQLREGLTPDQVVALFGEPNNGRVEPSLNCNFHVPSADREFNRREGGIHWCLDPLSRRQCTRLEGLHG